MLLERKIPVRAFVHKLDSRSDHLRTLGAEIIEGDLLNATDVRKALQGIKRAYFMYPVADGLLEAIAIFGSAAREAKTELVVNMSQLQNTPNVPSFRNLQHRLADQVLDWADVGAVHLQAPPFFENLLALIQQNIASKDTIFLPWGTGEAVIPLVAADDVARVATSLLVNPRDHDVNRYDLVGEAPTVKEIVQSLSEVLGRRIQYVPITDEAWAEAVRDKLNPHALDHLSHLWRFLRTTELARGGENGFHVSPWIEKLTERPPKTLRNFFEAHVSRLS
jgi:uncharacterized protein YbjT (DUF2867 family)